MYKRQGVTCVGTGPGSSNVLGGTFAAIKTVGCRVDHMIVKRAVAMKCAFGENPKRCYKDKNNYARMSTASKLRVMLRKAQEYQERMNAAGDDVLKRPAYDPKLEALLPVINREIDVYKRQDLVFTGRTLFGAMPPKGQEMDDHYFGAILERVGAYMKDVNEELWKLGVSAKTQHNEVAPAQHELAPIYSTANVAVDHNQLVMETLKKVAMRHGLTCLLHEKPFKGVNGSGKHNNWSIVTDDGINMLDPGVTPHENIQFLLVLACILKAVDIHADLLRESAADVGRCV